MTTEAKEAAKILSNPELTAYADELKANGKTENLRDLASKARAQAVRAGANPSKLPQTGGNLSDSELNRAVSASVVHGVDAAILQTARSIEEIPVANAEEMAALLIRAERYRGEPNAPESQQCKAKGIAWIAKVEPDQVCVVRSRQKGTTRKYTYDCADDATFQRLLKTVAQKRDQIKAQM